MKIPKPKNLFDSSRSFKSFDFLCNAQNIIVFPFCAIVNWDYVDPGIQNTSSMRSFKNTLLKFIHPTDVAQVQPC